MAISYDAFDEKGLRKTAVLMASAQLDFGSIAAGAVAELTIAVSGALATMPVALGLPANLNSGLVANALVTAADTVTVRVTNTTAGALDPANSWFQVAVFTSA